MPAKRFFRRGRQSRRPRRNFGNAQPNVNITVAPVINSTKIRRQTVRFATSSSGVSSSMSITRQSLLSIVVSCQGSATTTLVPLYTAVRVRGLKIYMPASTQATFQSLNFQWLSDLGSEARKINTVIGSVGYRSPYYRPPRLSRAAMWSRANSQTSTLQEVVFEFNLNDDQPDVVFLVDVDFDFLTDAESSALITSSSCSKTGVLYNPLDSLSTSSAVGTWELIPVGVESAFGSVPGTFNRSG
eukprot:GHVL01004346.1.p1 GENE.GHVL01004346.1~~GHVL01004346.1.p1  ORF type:complete len:243 (-),score=11.22 GHVL01004346.1:295-1023(-)